MNSFFGFIFWGVAWIRMRQEDFGPGWIGRLTLLKKLELLLNIFLILVGLFMLTAGTYVRIYYCSTTLTFFFSFLLIFPFLSFISILKNKQTDADTSFPPNSLQSKISKSVMLQGPLEDHFRARVMVCKGMTKS